jgi:hypothetical protein
MSIPRGSGVNTAVGSTPVAGPSGRAADPHDGADVERLRELARDGQLARVVAGAPEADRRLLTGAAYAVVWPIVFSRLTCRLERRRGHRMCSIDVHQLSDDCLDRFYDDVEAVVDDLLIHATTPIRNLEAWIASRLTAATVNGHRRLRGQRGALQRPRIPAWLAAELDQDPWLTTLSTEILIWVGVTTTAGTGVWPIDAWAERRAAVTGDWSASDPATVSREVDFVLSRMQRHQSWYIAYVETPLGRKQAPVVSTRTNDAGWEPASQPLSLRDPDEPEDAHLTRLAATAVRAIEARISSGEEAADAVVDVIEAVFGSGTATVDLDRSPYEVPIVEERLAARLTDRATVDRIVAAVLGILAEGG